MGLNCDCKSVFNSLSKASRLKLKGAALLKAITGFLQDETKAHPARYPFYAAYLLTVITPLPVPGVSVLVVGGTVMWAQRSKSEMAKRLNGRLKGAFNDDVALICDHKKFIEVDTRQAGKYRIRHLSLAWDTMKKNCSDARTATSHAWKALKTRSLS